MNRTLALLVLVGAGSALAAAPSATAAPSPRRLAVVVGANRASSGRMPLRYSYEDAQGVAEVLVQVGQFARSDVEVLLDPDPEAVLAALDRQLGTAHGATQESLVLFYYSGHADDRSLYPNGKALPLAQLKQRLDTPAATVRIGIIDACRGGAWTRTKGLQPGEAFEVDLPLALESEGSVLIASSSGIENAHETESLRGSFFTHHLLAALRGAADQSGDGEVSVGEAFTYAKALTIRDTAAVGAEPQHPSFDMKLHGRNDLPLTRVASSDSLVALQQETGPLQIIQASSGLIVLELPSGERAVKVAVPPGKYLVRRRSAQGTYLREISVAAGATVAIDEGSLELQGSPSLGSKSFEGPHPAALSTIPKGHAELRAAGGINHGPPLGGISAGSRDAAGTLSATWGLTDRLQWPILTPSLAYRLGERGAQEWIPWGGVTSWSAGYSTIESFLFSYRLGLGLDSRSWFSESQSLITGLSASSEGLWSALRTVAPTTWHGAVAADYSVSLGESVEMNLALAVGMDLGRASPNPVLGFGSVKQLGLRPLPLVQVHLSKAWSLDAYLSGRLELNTGNFVDTYMLGFTWNP